jgi:site-specific recombinase XerC
MYQSVVVEFLRTNSIKRITLDYSESKEIRRKTPKKYLVSTDKELTIEVIRAILQHSDVRIQALVYVLLSSGLRLSEALSIRLEDYEQIEGGYGKLKLTWLYAKTGREIFALTTPECTRVLNEWLKVRQKYINEKCISEGLKEDDPRIFPFSKNVATVSFHNILLRAGYKPTNGDKYPYHFHQFRSYFSSQLKLAVHPEIVMYLIGGHSRDIEAIYRKYSFRQVLDAYKSAVDIISVGTDPVLKKEYQKSIGEIEKLQKNQNLNNDQISTLITQLGLYQAQMNAMNEEIKSLKKYLKEHQIVIAGFAKSRGIKFDDIKASETKIVDGIVDLLKK